MSLFAVCSVGDTGSKCYKMSILCYIFSTTVTITTITIIYLFAALGFGAHFKWMKLDHALNEAKQS